MNIVAQEVLMPKLGLTMTEGTIGAWLKAEGSYVSKGEPLFEVATDKITNTVEALSEGILKVVVAEGDTAAVSQVVAYLLAEGEKMPATAPTEAAPAGPTPEEEQIPTSAQPKRKRIRVRASPAARRRAREAGIEVEKVQASGPQGRIVEADVEKYLEELEMEAASTTGPPVKATPTAAKLAQDLGVDLASLAREGRLTKRDVLAAALVAGEGEEERVPLAGMRKLIAEHMAESWRLAPHVTINMEVDMERVKILRQQLNALAEPAEKLSYNDFIIKAASKALTEYPLLNATISGEEIVYHHYVHLGVAVALKEGLIVPVVKHADKKSIQQVAREVKDLAERARNEALELDEITGGTFTVTNLGMYGIDDFTPIINQPESGILGVGAIKERPVVINDAVVIRPLMKLSLSFDHRLVDGSVAAEFLRRVQELLENPSGIRPELA